MTDDLLTACALTGLFVAFWAAMIAVQHRGSRRFLLTTLAIVAMGAVLVLFREQLPPVVRSYGLGVIAGLWLSSCDMKHPRPELGCFGYRR